MDEDLLAIGGSTQMGLHRLTTNAQSELTVTPLTTIRWTNFVGGIYEPVCRLAMQSNVIVAALSGDVSRNGGPGEIRVFHQRTNGVILVQTLHQLDSQQEILKPDRFGFSISLDSGWLAVGAPREDTQALQAGAVYLYQRMTQSNGSPGFELRQILYGPFPRREGAFGTSVAMRGRRLLVGAPGIYQNDNPNQGACYLFHLDGTNWAYSGEVRAPPHARGEYGTRVALGVSWAAAGARFSDTSNELTDRVAILNPNPYGLWAHNHQLTGLKANPTADPDHDGASNLQEFAYNLDPTVHDSTKHDVSKENRGLPVWKVMAEPRGNSMEVIQVRMKNAGRYGLTYHHKISVDLKHWTLLEEQALTRISVDENWERVVYSFPLRIDVDQEFLGLEVGLGE